MIRLLNKNSALNCSEESSRTSALKTVDLCKACAVYKNLVKNHTGLIGVAANFKRQKIEAFSVAFDCNLPSR